MSENGFLPRRDWEETRFPFSTYIHCLRRRRHCYSTCYKSNRRHHILNDGLHYNNFSSLSPVGLVLNGIGAFTRI